MSKLRIVFMGTPDFAAVILKAVAAWEGGEVVAVYTQPDRPAGRGKKLKASATKELALELGLPVYQPRNFRDDADVETLAGLRLIEAETPLKAQATCSGDETADIILQYYLPFITQEKPHNGLKPHEGTKSTGGTDNQV